MGSVWLMDSTQLGKDTDPFWSQVSIILEGFNLPKEDSGEKYVRDQGSEALLDQFFSFILFSHPQFIESLFNLKAGHLDFLFILQNRMLSC